ncbi:hypothetical protein B0H17DRAFT_1184314 [Mycena rosella]|uniref:Uncharacterized protein n=1 Tax=Mycena rosella TaxID=1033263 RepID=A0AAD7CW26_MYCRO|nr:hypothetical protein B0H17DRAFT_1184314 [Mycena rosella]
MGNWCYSKFESGDLRRIHQVGGRLKTGVDIQCDQSEVVAAAMGDPAITLENIQESEEQPRQASVLQFALLKTQFELRCNITLVHIESLTTKELLATVIGVAATCWTVGIVAEVACIIAEDGRKYESRDGRGRWVQMKEDREDECRDYCLTCELRKLAELQSYLRMDYFVKPLSNLDCGASRFGWESKGQHAPTQHAAITVGRSRSRPKAPAHMMHLRMKTTWISDAQPEANGDKDQ